jgi:glycosyltransferase involved in cell wall biosynthesis
MKVVFLLYRLNLGGTERQVITLTKGLKDAGADVSILCFYSGGALEREAKGANLDISALDKRGRWDIIGFLWRFYIFLRQEKPDALHSYLSLANVAAVLIKPFFQRMKFVWGLRATVNNVGRNDRLDRLIFIMEKMLSRFADLIIYNSQAGHTFYTNQGFADRNSAIIPNGIDTVRFCPNPGARLQIRRELSISEIIPMIGIVARYHPMKGYSVFIDAALDFLGAGYDANFILVGTGISPENAALIEPIRAAGKAQYFHLLGERHDIPALMSALDIYTSTSIYGEGFSNSIGEAMACGVPCVVTDVGDSALIVGETGIVVPRGEPSALKDAWETMLTWQASRKAELANAARERIVKNFSTEHLVEQTQQTLEQLVNT